MGVLQGEMKLQIDRMIAKFFSSLPADEQLNFSVAVTVMSVQRKWRQRMKAHKARSHTLVAQHSCGTTQLLSLPLACGGTQIWMHLLLFM